MGDLSDDLSIVDAMLERYERGYKIVCASRYMKGGRQIGGPLVKRTLSRWAGLSLYYLAGLPTHDVTNNFKLYDKALLDEIPIESLGGFELAMELTVKAFKKGYSICEVPAVWQDRTAGASRFKLWKWLPHYLRWYLYALSASIRRFGGNTG
jgi:dolichol-phosphate mannosyltransferase